MKIKFLEKGIVYSEIQYDLDEKYIKKNKELTRIIDKYKKGKELSSYEKEYLYKEINYLASVCSSEIIEYPDEYVFEELQDYEE